MRVEEWEQEAVVGGAALEARESAPWAKASVSSLQEDGAAVPCGLGEGLCYS